MAICESLAQAVQVWSAVIPEGLPVALPCAHSEVSADLIQHYHRPVFIGDTTESLRELEGGFLGGCRVGVGASTHEDGSHVEAAAFELLDCTLDAGKVIVGV